MRSCLGLERIDYAQSEIIALFFGRKRDKQTRVGEGDLCGVCGPSIVVEINGLRAPPEAAPSFEDKLIGASASNRAHPRGAKRTQHGFCDRNHKPTLKLCLERTKLCLE